MAMAFTSKTLERAHETMKMKITAKTPVQIERVIGQIMTTACQIICRGAAPILDETGKPYQLNESAKRYELIPSLNDHWANIRHQEPDYLVIEFNFRYDRNGDKKRTLTELICAWFPDNTELIAQ